MRGRLMAELRELWARRDQQNNRPGYSRARCDQQAHKLATRVADDSNLTLGI